eukprot:scaffold65309_cov32-Tisochrysis_lutea.AAC.4
MELVDGTNLAEPIYKKRQVPEEDLRHWLREIILGLEHMHLHEVSTGAIASQGLALWLRCREAHLSEGSRMALAFGAWTPTHTIFAKQH